MIIYKEKLRNLLKEKGYSMRYLKTNNIIGGQTMANISSEGNITTKTINDLCNLLECQPGDFLEFVPDDSNLL